MKKTVLFALISGVLVMSSTANAAVKLKDSKQTVSVQTGGIINVAAAGGTAQQNIASNVGDVEISGKNEQLVTVGQGGIINVGAANGAANQNIASNSSEGPQTVAGEVMGGIADIIGVIMQGKK